MATAAARGTDFYLHRGATWRGLKPPMMDVSLSSGHRRAEGSSEAGSAHDTEPLAQADVIVEHPVSQVCCNAKKNLFYGPQP